MTLKQQKLKRTPLQEVKVRSSRTRLLWSYGCLYGLPTLGSSIMTTAMDDMKLPQSITAIVAATKSNGIGMNGTLPWRLPGEMKYFARGELRFWHVPTTAPAPQTVSLKTAARCRRHDSAESIRLVALALTLTTRQSRPVNPPLLPPPPNPTP